MITVADVRSSDTRIDTETAQRITDLWNVAYPHMRTALTAVIDGNRRYLAEADRWQLSEEKQAATARRIKETEQIRRELGQLDGSTLRACTRSMGGFYVSGALALVMNALPAFSFGSPHLGDAYRLAAVLADVVGARTAARQAADRQDAEVTP